MGRISIFIFLKKNIIATKKQQKENVKNSESIQKTRNFECILGFCCRHSKWQH